MRRWCDAVRTQPEGGDAAVEPVECGRFGGVVAAQDANVGVKPTWASSNTISFEDSTFATRATHVFVSRVAERSATSKRP